MIAERSSLEKNIVKMPTLRTPYFSTPTLFMCREARNTASLRRSCYTLSGRCYDQFASRHDGYMDNKLHSSEYSHFMSSYWWEVLPVITKKMEV